jgi:hypothetical protein
LKQLDAEIWRQIEGENLSRSFEIVQSVPAIRQIAASATLAELGSSWIPFCNPEERQVIALTDGEAYGNPIETPKWKFRRNRFRQEMQARSSF